MCAREKWQRRKNDGSRIRNTWPWSNFCIWISWSDAIQFSVFSSLFWVFRKMVHCSPCEHAERNHIWACNPLIIFLFNSIAWCQVLCSHCARQPIVNLQLHSDSIPRLFHFWRRRVPRVEDSAHCVWHLLTMRTKIRSVKNMRIKWYNPRFTNVREFRYAHLIWNYYRPLCSICLRVNESTTSWSHCG